MLCKNIFILAFGAAPTFDPSCLARETVSGNAWLSKNVDTVERFPSMGDSSKSVKGVNFYGVGAFRAVPLNNPLLCLWKIEIS